jgi:AmiR/NasT family two-component response regulator
MVRGVSAGIGDGAQLSDHEAADLAHFCQQMAHHGAPVIALLDFPRRDRMDLARQLGAAAVLGKPWLNAALVSMLEESLVRTKRLAA